MLDFFKNLNWMMIVKAFTVGGLLCVARTNINR